MTTGIALICNTIFAIIFKDFSFIFVAFTAESSDRPVNIFCLHLVLIIAVCVETFLNDITFLHCSFHAFCITVCTIAACLIQKLRMNTNTRQLHFNILFMMPCIIFITLKSIWHHRNRIAQIILKDFWLWHVACGIHRNRPMNK